jgi:hypothetical protein
MPPILWRYLRFENDLTAIEAGQDQMILAPRNPGKGPRCRPGWRGTGRSRRLETESAHEAQCEDGVRGLSVT